MSQIEKRFPRRTILRDGIRAVLIVPAPRFLTSSDNTGENPFGNLVELYRNSYEVSIEKKYDVDIRTFEENLNEIAQDRFNLGAIGGEKVRKWDIERLLLLSRILPIIPEHFRARGQHGQRLRITLAKDSLGTCCGWGESAGYPHQVVVSDDQFNPDNPRQALLFLAHENIHVVDPYSKVDPKVATTVNSAGGDLAQFSSWWRKIDLMLGQSYHQLSLNLSYQVRAKLFEQGSKYGVGLDGKGLDPRYSDEVRPYDRMYYAFLSNQGEFIAVGGELYFFGREKFLAWYSQFLGEQKSLEFYEFIKDEVFMGQEFSAFPIKEFDSKVMLTNFTGLN